MTHINGFRQESRRRRVGLCIWLTGLSGAGKSTTADGLARWIALRGRAACLLDGDVIRARPGAVSGYSRQERHHHALTVAGMAVDAMASGSIAICALISPYRATRAAVRRLVAPHRMCEVFVDTPLDVCRSRDPKGLYKRAANGSLEGLTGVGAPYEQPLRPDVVVKTADHTVDDGVELIVAFLEGRGWLD